MQAHKYVYTHTHIFAYINWEQQQKPVENEGNANFALVVQLKPPLIRTVDLPGTAKGFLSKRIRICGRIISSSCLPLVCKPQSPAVDWSWLRISLSLRFVSLYTFVGSFFYASPSAFASVALSHFNCKLLPSILCLVSCVLFLFFSTCLSNLSGKLVKRAQHSASVGCTAQCVCVCVCARQTCTASSHGLKCTLLTHTSRSWSRRTLTPTLKHSLNRAAALVLWPSDSTGFSRAHRKGRPSHCTLSTRTHTLTHTQPARVLASFSQ